MFKFFRCDKEHVEKFFEKMDSRSVRKEITKNGDV
jgi:hypothetical protein